MEATESTSPSAPATAPDPVVVSGIQPSGRLHLGNYFGAIRQHIDLHQEHEAFYFIVNYHAMTTVQDAEQLRQHTFDVALDYLALGFDPDEAALFVKDSSAVSQSHSRDERPAPAVGAGARGRSERLKYR